MLQAADHHLDRDHGVVDQQAQRDDQRTERNALERDAEIIHRHEDERQNQRNRDRHDESGPQPQAEEAHHQHDQHRFDQRLGEAADRRLDDLRLIRYEMHADADRQPAFDLAHSCLQIFAELQ